MAKLFKKNFESKVREYAGPRMGEGILYVYIYIALSETVIGNFNYTLIYWIKVFFRLPFAV